jgi:hypothetical protein
MTDDQGRLILTELGRAVARADGIGPETLIDAIPPETLAAWGKDLLTRYFAHLNQACVFDEYGHIRRGSDIGTRLLIYCATFDPCACYNYSEMAKRAGVTRAYLSKLGKQMVGKLGAEVPVFHAGAAHQERGAAKANHEERVRREDKRLQLEIARRKLGRATA